jgi:hypothetical protein
MEKILHDDVLGLTISMFFGLMRKETSGPSSLFRFSASCAGFKRWTPLGRLLAEIGLASAGEEVISKRKSQSASVGSGGDLFRSSKG